MTTLRSGPGGSLNSLELLHLFFYREEEVSDINEDIVNESCESVNATEIEPIVIEAMKPEQGLALMESIRKLFQINRPVYSSPFGTRQVTNLNRMGGQNPLLLIIYSGLTSFQLHFYIFIVQRTFQRQV